MKNKKAVLMFILTIISAIFSISFFAYAFYQRNFYKERYDFANRLINENKYSEAVEVLVTLREYRDVEEILINVSNEQIYLDAINYFEKQQYKNAINAFTLIQDYRDSSAYIYLSQYHLGIEYFEQEKYEEAKKIFIELEDFKESRFYLAQIDIKLLEQSQEIIYQKAYEYYKEKKYEEAIDLYYTIINYKESNEFLLECKKQLKRTSHNNILAAGLRNSLVITSDNKVKNAGKNGFGQLNTDTWNDIVSIDIYGTLSIGLQKDNVAKIAGTFDNKEITNLEKWCDLVDVAAGEQFVVGLKSNKTVIADGHPSDGQLNVNDWNNIIAIDAGSRFVVALTEDKELLFAGFDNGQSEEFESHRDEWNDVVNISASGGEKGYNGVRARKN